MFNEDNVKINVVFLGQFGMMEYLIRFSLSDMNCSYKRLSQ